MTLQYRRDIALVFFDNVVEEFDVKAELLYIGGKRLCILWQTRTPKAAKILVAVEIKILHIAALYDCIFDLLIISPRSFAYIMLFYEITVRCFLAQKFRAKCEL